MKIYFRILLFVFAISPILSWAQPQNNIANFMYNQLIYNPASAGMHESQFNASVLTRLQWSTIEGAPVVGAFWTDYRFKDKKMAIGLNANNVSFSGYSNTDLNANYAYNLPLNKKLTLAMGLRAGIYSSKFSLDKFTIWDDQDNIINTSTYKYTLFKAGAGVQLNARKAYIGLSVPDLFLPYKPEVTSDSSKSFFSRKRNFILMGGARIPLNDLYNLRPNIAFFYHGLAGFRGNINTTFEIKDYFWLGVTYSTVKSFTVLLGTNISSRVRFGYAFEFYTGETTFRNLNTHEINLSMQFDNLFRKKK